MKRTLSSTLFVLALLLAPVLAQPAAAQSYSGFSVGGWFRVGPVSLSLAFGAPFEGSAPGYYYRVPARYGHVMPPCQDAFRMGPYIYYAASCSAMDSYLGYYHLSPALLFQAYAPPPVWRGFFYGSYSSLYGDYGRHGRYGRYDTLRDRDWRRDLRRERGRSWSRVERRDYYERYGFSRRGAYRHNSDRDRDRNRDRRDQWRHHR